MHARALRSAGLRFRLAAWAPRRPKAVAAVLIRSFCCGSPFFISLRCAETFLSRGIVSPLRP